jgi:hypothetical protein
VSPTEPFDRFHERKVELVELKTSLEKLSLCSRANSRREVQELVAWINGGLGKPTAKT